MAGASGGAPGVDPSASASTSGAAQAQGGAGGVPAASAGATGNSGVAGEGAKEGSKESAGEGSKEAAKGREGEAVDAREAAQVRPSPPYVCLGVTFRAPPPMCSPPVQLPWKQHR